MPSACPRLGVRRQVWQGWYCATPGGLFKNTEPLPSSSNLPTGRVPQVRRRAANDEIAPTELLQRCSRDGEVRAAPAVPPAGAAHAGVPRRVQEDQRPPRPRGYVLRGVVRCSVENEPDRLPGWHGPRGRVAEAGRTWVPPRAASGAGKACSAPFWPKLGGPCSRRDAWRRVASQSVKACCPSHEASGPSSRQ